MFMVPTGILSLWFMGIWGYGLIAGGLYLLYKWHQRAMHYSIYSHQYVFHPVLGWNTETTLLVWGIILLFLPTLGGIALLPIIRALCRKQPSDLAKGTAFPKARGVLQRISRPDGTAIQAEVHGPEDGPSVVLSHGWGTNRTEWEYLRRDLIAKGYRLIVWDMPGLGDSDQRADRDFSLESFASDLDLVTRETCGDRPVVLAGHSIGGMTTLTFCRIFPEALGTRVVGVLLVNTTYTDPVHTALGSALFRPLEKPVLMPLQYLTIALSPLFRLSNLMSYFNGMGHLFSLLSGFGGSQSREELDFSTRYTLNAPPAVIARGMIGMMRYDATEVLKRIPVSTLVVTGDRDVCCKPDASEHMAREIPNARLVTLSPANHMGLMEQHSRFAEVVGDFFSQCFADTRTAQP